MTAGTIAIIVGIVVIVGALVYWLRTRKTTSTTSTATSIESAVADLKQHVEATVASAADGIKTRVATVGTVVIDKLSGAQASPAKAQATQASPTPAAAASAAPVAPSASSPAAPAASAASATPPAAAAASAGSPASGSGTWPQVIEIDGVHLLADAPINPAWKIDDDTRVHDSPTSYLGEPSNGGKCTPPQPIRSPAGFPLFYAIGAGGAPVGAPRVLYGNTSYPDDASLQAAIAAKASDDAAHDVAAASAANQVFAGPVPVSMLTKPDLEFLWWATINPATPTMHNWEYTVLSGSRAAIQAAMNTVGQTVAWLQTYDATQYTGVLRSYYDAAIAAPVQA